MRWILAGLALLAAPWAAAQITVIPSDPHPRTPITLSVLAGCGSITSSAINQGTITLSFVPANACVTLPPSHITIGLLAAGTYTVKVVDVTNPTAPPIVTTTFQVTAPPSVPASDQRWLAALAVLLVLAALFALGRG